MKIKWTRSKVYGFMRYTSPLGRAVIHETHVRENVGAGWGRPRHVATRKKWRVWVDGHFLRIKVPSHTALGDIMIDTFDTLKQAKAAAEAALSS
jgi:hypothetical protein